jgi:hypothetical protein
MIKNQRRKNRQLKRNKHVQTGYISRLKTGGFFIFTF